MAAAGGSWKGGRFIAPAGGYAGEPSFGREVVRREKHGVNRGQVLRRTIDIERDFINPSAPDFLRTQRATIGQLVWSDISGQWSLKNRRGNTVASYGSTREAKRAATAWANQIRTEADL